jgi:hypothetical protein
MKGTDGSASTPIPARPVRTIVLQFKLSSVHCHSARVCRRLVLLLLATLLTPAVTSRVSNPHNYIDHVFKRP